MTGWSVSDQLEEVLIHWRYIYIYMSSAHGFTLYEYPLFMPFIYKNTQTKNDKAAKL
jgi:hypothetical protein